MEISNPSSNRRRLRLVGLRFRAPWWSFDAIGSAALYGPLRDMMMRRFIFDDNMLCFYTLTDGDLELAERSYERGDAYYITNYAYAIDVHVSRAKKWRSCITNIEVKSRADPQRLATALRLARSAAPLSSHAVFGMARSGAQEPTTTFGPA
jgi:hypothetical protein